MQLEANSRIKRGLILVSTILIGVLTGVSGLRTNAIYANANSQTSNVSTVPQSLVVNKRILLPMVGQSPPPAPGPEWSMLAANPQRTSWTPEEVRGDLSVEWYRPIEPYIPYKVQPIAANGKIYVSTARGLYAFNATNGNVDWIYPTELPLGHSPTVATVNGRLVAYVGGYDHKIHAIDANSGQDIVGYTPYEAVAGFETNPLIINDAYTANAPVIFAGNRDGYFYALDAVTGALKWKFLTQGPILFSAAYKNGTVYFASNDMHAYALNVSNGIQVWQSAKLPGQSFSSYWPVIYTNKSSGKDYVVFDSGANYRQSELSLTGDETAKFNAQYSGGVLPTGNVPGDWVAGTVTIDVSIITNYIANYQYRRTVMFLDSSNGLEFTFTDPKSGGPTYAPFSWSGVTHAGTRYPAIVNGVDGVFYQQTAYNFGGWVTRGAAVGWKFGTQYVSLVQQQTGNPDDTASDEPTSYSSGGRIVYSALCCDRAASGYDITIPFGQPNRNWTYWGYSLASNTLAPGYQQMYDDGNTQLFNDGNGWQIYSWQHQGKNGVYGKHGTVQSPPIPYKGKLYFLRGNALLAFSASGSGPTTPLPLAMIVSTTSAPRPPTTADLTQRLTIEVQKILVAGRLRPGYHPSGVLDQYGEGWYNDAREFGEIFDYFQNPADTVYTLLLAYPYLSPVLQTQVKAYLQNNYGPGTADDFTKIVHVGWANGASREWSDLPPDVATLGNWGTSDKPPLNPSPSPICPGGCGLYWQAFPPFNFYAGWKYAQYVGNNDSAFAADIFNLMSNKIEAPPNDTFLVSNPYFINQYAAGYLGYIQLKQLAGLGADPTIQGYYNHMLSLRISNFSKDTPYWNSDTGSFGQPGNDYHRALSVARNFMFLTPEIGNYMAQQPIQFQSQVQLAISEYNLVAPYWFVSRFDGTFAEGAFQPLYDYPALFQAKAYILKQPYNELVKWLDVPAFRQGDLFYIQNLVAALSATP